MQISIILLAGGIGSRMGGATPKQFLLLAGKPIALYSYEYFSSLPHVSEIIVVCAKEHQHFFPENTRFALPGKERQHSVQAGLKALSFQDGMVCVHDAARPFVSLLDMNALIHEAFVNGGAISAVKTKNTIKLSSHQDLIVETLNRSLLWDVHTPQILPIKKLSEGLALAQEKNILVTDDAQALELMGHSVKLVAGSYFNIKITTAEDLIFAETIVETLLCPSTK